MNQVNNFNQDRKALSQQGSDQRQRPASQPQRTPAPRMPKPQALALVRKMKRGIVVASFLSFGTFSAFALGHTVSAAAQQTTTTVKTTHVLTPTATATSKTTVTIPTATATSSPATPTATAQQGGYSFGSGTSTNAPVSGTHTS